MCWLMAFVLDIVGVSDPCCFVGIVAAAKLRLRLVLYAGP